MINQAACLLMNVRPTEPSSSLGFVLDRRFGRFVPPAPLREFRRVLFGVAPDRFMLEYRTWQILRTLSHTQFGEFAKNLGGPHAYDSLDDHEPQLISYGGNVRSLGNSPDAELIGSPKPPDLSGWTAFNARVAISDDQAFVALDSPVSKISVISLNGEGIESVPIDDTGYSLSFHYANNAVWRVNLLLKPAKGPGELLSDLKSLSEETIAYLFGQSQTENLNTEDRTRLDNLLAAWSRSIRELDRFNAIVCAYLVRAQALGVKPAQKF